MKKLKRILILEGGTGIEREMEEAICILNKLGYYTCLIDDCYSNLEPLLNVLKDKPDIIWAQTTFTYKDKINSLLGLLPQLYTIPKKRKQEIWITSHNATRIFSLFPEQYLDYFQFFDLNPLQLIFGVEKAKNKIKP